MAFDPTPPTAEQLLDMLGLDASDPELRRRMDTVRPQVEAALAREKRLAGMRPQQRAITLWHERRRAEAAEKAGATGSAPGDVPRPWE